MITEELDFGKRLAQAREGKRLSVEEAARATRMRGSHIEALESSNLSSFANAAYAKSFLIMYARFLGVDISDVAKSIDTTTQVGVNDFQYLSSRAADDKEFQRAAADSRCEFGAPRRESRSWIPLAIAGAAAVVAGIVLMISMNLSRIADDEPIAKAEVPATPAPAAAVEPIEPAAPLTPSSASAKPIAAVGNPSAGVAPAIVAPVAPRAQVAATTPPSVAATTPAPVQVEVPVAEAPVAPKARAVAPPATVVATDREPIVAPIPAARPIATPPPASVVSVNKDDADVVLLEPRRKTWVVIRSGPGGQPLFEDFLYPNSRPMRLPPGKYYIELKEADAVAIVRNGKRISYVAPGVLVQ